jgi:integrase
VYPLQLGKLFKIAKIEGGHAQRFRHTFAVGLLLAGVPIESVSALLGHTSVKTTIPHDSPWILARQKRFEKSSADGLDRQAHGIKNHQ